MNPKLLIAIYVGAACLPLIAAWLEGLPARSLRNEIASAAGMLAYTVVLIEFVLSGRFRSVSARLGLDKAMRFHQLVARVAVVLAILHPYLYAAAGTTGYPWDTTRQFSLASDPGGMATGILAWFLLPALVVLAVQREQLGYRYETWRLMHGIGAVLIAGLVLHHALVLGRYSQSVALTWIWVALFLVAVAALANVYLVKPLLQRRKPWKVQSIKPIAKKVWEVSVEPDGHAGMTYRAGQFAWLNIGHSPFSLRENPFSISSAPASGPGIQFVIKELGDFTSTIGQIKPGTAAYVDGPHGNLVTTRHHEPGIVLIAGGVGIAPLVSILRELRHNNDKRDSMLIYGNRTDEQIVYRNELDEFTQEMGTRVELVLAEPPGGWTGHSGLIDANLVRKLIDDSCIQTDLFVLCGPPGMMSEVTETLLALGVSTDRILAERFTYD